MIKQRIWLTAAQRIEIIRLYEIEKLSPPVIATRYGVCANNIRNALDAAGVERRDRIESRRQYTHDEHAFYEITPDSAYWTGFLFADGSISHHQVGSDSLDVSVADCDREHLVKLRAFLRSNHPIYNVTTRGSRIDGRWIAPKKQTRLAFRSQPIVDTLSRLGMRNKSLDRVTSKELIASRDFWRGLVDGDGYIGWNPERPRIGLCGGRILMEQFLVFVQTLGVAPLATVRQRKKLFIVGFTKQTATQIIATLYTFANISLDRKQLRADAVLHLCAR
jgi:hypothetical protein